MTVSTVTINLTAVLVYGVPAWIGAIFAGLAMLRSGANGRAMKTSNGSTPGEMIERTHELAESAAAASPPAEPEQP